MHKAKGCDIIFLKRDYTCSTCARYKEKQFFITKRARARSLTVRGACVCLFVCF